MDEIENLIGEAVRVELNMPQNPQPVRYPDPPQMRAASQPAVPPLSGQFAPRRTTSLRDAEVSHSAADEAILAAAAATGAEVGRIDYLTPTIRCARPSRSPAAASATLASSVVLAARSRQLVVPAVAGTILLALGFGLYWALGMGHNDGKVPVLTADATPAKTDPAKPATDADSHSVVMDQLSGTAPPPASETLVSRDQSDNVSQARQRRALLPRRRRQPSSGHADDGLANPRGSHRDRAA